MSYTNPDTGGGIDGHLDVTPKASLRGSHGYDTSAGCDPSKPRDGSST